MKILMLNYEFPPMGGGAGNATNNISKELAKMGHQVTVLTSKYENLPNMQVVEGVKIYRVFSWRKDIHDCGFRGAFTYVLFAAIKLWKLRKIHKFDVLHYFFSLPTGLLSLLPWAFRNVPYIVSLRGSDVPYYDVYNRKVHFLNVLLKPINLYIWKNAKKVIALSPSLKLTAMKTAPKQHIEVIPNAVETDIFNPTYDPKTQDHKFKLITVSRLIKRKAIDHILTALAEINDKSITLLIVGTGSHERILKNVSNELHLNDVVEFYGYCPREQLPEQYNRSDVFILPTLAESFGMVFVEAMACALPIIGAKTGGVVEIVHSENGILVEPGNIEEIKRAILKMKHSYQTRVSMGYRNRERVLKHYSWKSISQKYLHIYKKVLSPDNTARL